MAGMVLTDLAIPIEVDPAIEVREGTLNEAQAASEMMGRAYDMPEEVARFFNVLLAMTGSKVKNRGYFAYVDGGTEPVGWSYLVFLPRFADRPPRRRRDAARTSRPRHLHRARREAARRRACGRAHRGGHPGGALDVRADRREARVPRGLWPRVLRLGRCAAPGDPDAEARGLARRTRTSWRPRSHRSWPFRWSDTCWATRCSRNDSGSRSRAAPVSCVFRRRSCQVRSSIT